MLLFGSKFAESVVQSAIRSLICIYFVVVANLHHPSGQQSFYSVLQVEEYDDIKSGYRIKLTFDENPFFENEVLTKEFHLGSADPTSTSSDIKWKENMDLLKKSAVSIVFALLAHWNHSHVMLQDAEAKAGRKRPAGAMMTPRTFFSWYVDNTDASADDIAEVCSSASTVTSVMAVVCSRCICSGDQG